MEVQRRIGLLGAILGIGVLTSCEGASPTDGSAATTDPHLGEVTCTEILEASDEHQQTLSTTFGGGAEGRAAQRAVVELVEARPDCFREDTVEFARQMREMLPSSDAEREAIEDAENRCADGVVGSWASSRPEDSPHA